VRATPTVGAVPQHPPNAARSKHRPFRPLDGHYEPTEATLPQDGRVDVSKAPAENLCPRAAHRGVWAGEFVESYRGDEASGCPEGLGAPQRTAGSRLAAW
jgi:hypothetical protein